MSVSRKNQDDIEFISRLIGEGGLQLIKKERIIELTKGGIVGCVCSDGDYSLILDDNLRRVNKRLHLIKTHGGPIILGLEPKSYNADDKEYIRCAQLVQLRDLGEAFHDLNKGTAILLIAHGPHCGKAAKLGVTLPGMIQTTMKAVEVITGFMEVSRNIVLPMFLMDWSYGKGSIKKDVELYVIKNGVLNLI